MGELQTFSSSNNPIFIVIMRNSRGKLFVYVGILCVLCFIVFLLNNTHTSLKELEGINEKCQQQRDSLSAQLQVVYEHKNRLEKSLQQEKTDHKHTKDVHEKEASELENKIQKEKDEKQKIENQISQLKTSYAELEDEKMQAENAIKQQLKTVQTQKDAEIEKLQNHISELLSEKEKLEVSNNAYVWKIEQHESEINLCHLQLQQAKTELNTCQEQFARHNLNTVDVKLKDKPIVAEKKATEAGAKTIKSVTPPKVVTPSLVTSPKNKLPEVDQRHENKTVATPPLKGKTVEKPHVMPVNNLGDGVLPKPLDLKPEEEKDKDIDAALEITDDEKSKKLVDDNMLDNAIDKGIPKYDLLNKKVENIQKEISNLSNIAQNGLYNEPQALPPMQFDRADDKDDHAGERGDDGLQYNNPPELKQQVEIPDFRKQNEQKEVLPNPPIENNDIAAQMSDMMNKSPGNVANNQIDQNVLGLPLHNVGPIDNKILDLKNGRPFLHRGGDAHRVMEDKNYEEDDDDRENDDEPVNGLAPMLKGNVLQDNDFDDQENPDNGDNAKEEEGVMAAPK